MRKFIKPDWKHNILNISATLAEFLGAPNDNATLPLLKQKLAKGYKNIVYICFDGLGVYPLEHNLAESDFLRRHVAQVLTSTFPSTTTNATTSLCTNKLPLQHGWLGWSLHIPTIGRNVDIFARFIPSTSTAASSSIRWWRRWKSFSTQWQGCAEARASISFTPIAPNRTAVCTTTE